MWQIVESSTENHLSAANTPDRVVIHFKKEPMDEGKEPAPQKISMEKNNKDQEAKEQDHPTAIPMNGGLNNFNLEPVGYEDEEFSSDTERPSANGGGWEHGYIPTYMPERTKKTKKKRPSVAENKKTKKKRPSVAAVKEMQKLRRWPKPKPTVTASASELIDPPPSSQLRPTPHTCHECKISYRRLSLLQKHFSIKHKGRKFYPCTKAGCTFWTNRQVSLENHIYDKHPPLPPTKHVCALCQHAFWSPTELRNHEINEHFIHNCSHCSEGFFSRPELLKHFARKHKEKLTHFCEICNTAFMILSELNEHNRKFHPELGKKIPPPKRLYPCPHCDLVFHKRARITLHLRRKTCIKKRILAQAQQEFGQNLNPDVIEGPVVPKQEIEDAPCNFIVTVPQEETTIKTDEISIKEEEGRAKKPVDEGKEIRVERDTPQKVSMENSNKDQEAKKQDHPTALPTNGGLNSVELEPVDYEDEEFSSDAEPANSGGWEHGYIPTYMPKKTKNKKTNNKKTKNKKTKKKRPSVAAVKKMQKLPREMPEGTKKTSLRTTNTSLRTSVAAVNEVQKFDFKVKSRSRPKAKAKKLFRWSKPKPSVAASASDFIDPPPSTQRRPTPHTCDVCKTSYRRLSLLQKHFSTKHKSRKFYPCTKTGCTFWTNRPISLENHIYDKHPPLPPTNHVCALCQHAFWSPTELRNHEINEHFIHNCSHCSEGFFSRPELLKHFARKHKEKLTHFCEICNTAFMILSELNEHNRKFHPELVKKIPPPKRSYPCPHCDLVFHKRAAITLHLRRKTCIKKRILAQQEFGQNFNPDVKEELGEQEIEDDPCNFIVTVSQEETTIKTDEISIKEEPTFIEEPPFIDEAPIGEDQAELDIKNESLFIIKMEQ